MLDAYPILKRNNNPVMSASILDFDMILSDKHLTLFHTGYCPSKQKQIHVTHEAGLVKTPPKYLTLS